MKKLIFSVILIFIALFSFSQEWERDYNFEEVLLDDWDVELQVWVMENADGTMTINFEDYYSRDWDDIYYQLAFALLAFEEILYDFDVDFEESDINTLIFSWFEIQKQRPNPPSRFGPQQERSPQPNILLGTNESRIRWDMFMEYDWLIRYFNSRFNRQFRMIEELTGPVYEEWLDTQEEEKRNFFNRKR